jgi:hypothetical protein
VTRHPWKGAAREPGFLKRNHPVPNNFQHRRPPFRKRREFYRQRSATSNVFRVTGIGLMEAAGVDGDDNMNVNGEFAE